MSAGPIAPNRFGDRTSRPAPGDRAWTLSVLVPVAALTALGAVLRFYAIGRQGFWFDEANTAQLVHFSPGVMFGLIPRTESTPPLYYAVAWLWSRVFGAGEVGLRSYSALCGTLIVPVAYGIGSTLSTRRVGLVAASLVACSPFLIWYSQEARSYEMLALLTAVALLAMVRARRSPTAGALALWVASSVLALATHYYAVVAIIPQALWLLYGHPRRRSVQIAVGLVLLCGVALIPLALTQNSTRRDRWIAHAPLKLRLKQLVPQFFIGTGIPDRDVFKYLGYALGALALLLLAVRGTRAERRGGLIAGGLLVVAALMVIVLMLAGFDDLITRNLIALFVPGLLLLATGFGARRAGWLGLGGAAALCAIGIFATFAIAANRNLQRPDWRPVARALGPGPQPGEPGRAILIQHYRTLLPLSLYLRGLHELKHRGVVVNELDVISVRPWPGLSFCWWGAACNLSPSRMQDRYAVPGFRPLWRRRVHQFTILRLVARHPVLLRGADVAPALHSTRLRRDEIVFQRGRAARY